MIGIFRSPKGSRKRKRARRVGARPVVATWSRFPLGDASKYLILCPPNGGLNMFNYDYDEDDEQFYKETVYNEAYYIEREQELIRQSNLEIELEELEEKYIREMREEGLLRPTLVKPGENRPEAEVTSPHN